MLVVKVEESYAFCFQILHIDQLDNDNLSWKRKKIKWRTHNGNHQLTKPHNFTHLALPFFFYLTKKWLILCLFEKNVMTTILLLTTLLYLFPNWKIQFNGMLYSNSILHYQSNASFKQLLSRPYRCLKRCFDLLINKQKKHKLNLTWKRYRTIKDKFIKK